MLISLEQTRICHLLLALLQLSFEGLSLLSLLRQLSFELCANTTGNARTISDAVHVLSTRGAKLGPLTHSTGSSL